MRDTISRQAAIDALAKFVPYAICDESTESYTNGLTDAYNLICQLPSAEPEIISCLDCIHYTPLGIDKSWGRCAVHSSPTENQRMCQSCDFCSWAERRTDG